MKKTFPKYKIGTTIQRIDGTFDYCVEVLVDVFFDIPGYREIYRGTKEECEKELERLIKQEEV